MGRSESKIGILGGTFDPPHIAHLRIAEEARLAFNLKEIWFIPAGLPPHKFSPQTSFENRFRMVQLAIQNNPFFKVLDIEKTSQPSYTLKTLQRLKKDFSNFLFYLILGWDAFFEIETWWHYQEFLDYAEIIVLSRGKGNWKGGEKKVKDYAQKLWKKKEKVHFLEVFPLEISSSLIKKFLEEKKSIRYLVPEEVYFYILEHKLYQR